MTQDRGELLKTAERLFFSALMHGYAGGSEKIVSLDGHTKTTLYAAGKWVVKDEYHTIPDSDFSSGTTLITHHRVPIWWMAYGGRYPKTAIPFLKQVLRCAYEKNEFCGGRGLANYPAGQLHLLQHLWGRFQRL